VNKEVTFERFSDDSVEVNGRERKKQSGTGQRRESQQFPS